MKKKVSLLHLIHHLCELIRNHGQQEPLPAPQQGGNLLYENAVDAVKAGINENLKQLMDAHNLNLPPDWTFPQFTSAVFGEELNDLSNSFVQQDVD